MGKGQRIAAMLIVFMLVCPSVRADLYMKHKQKMDAFVIMGQKQPARESISESWIAKDGMWSNQGQHGFIIQNKGSMIFLDHDKKTYFEMSTDPNEVANNLGKDMDASEKAAFQKFMGKMMETNVDVQPTNEKKEINGYPCKKYIQTLNTAMGTVTTIIWATTKIKIDADLYAAYSAAMLANQPGMQQKADGFISEMKKIKGVQVLSETTQSMMGSEMKSSMELLQVKEGKSPNSIFTIPKGYQKMTMEM